MIEILPYGDQAVLVQFEQIIDLNINKQILALHQFLKNAAIKGILDFIPAYCSLTILYDPDRQSFEFIEQSVKQWTQNKQESALISQKRKLSIPICYDPAFGLDLAELAEKKEISEAELIRLHTQKQYHVYMLGFLPGFVYMGTIDVRLQCARKKVPRLKVPAGSLGLAGSQTGIYPMDAPGGWQIIGRCPIPIFQPDHHEPFLFQSGDQVRFEAISLEEFEAINRWIENGQADIQELILRDD